jgi:hypothetical protein
MNPVVSEPRPLADSTRLIPLSRGKFARVDEQDYEELCKHKWHAQRGGKLREIWYAERKSEGSHSSRTKIMMHRQILGLVKGDGKIVDHKDGNGLNNTRANLRIATAAQNTQNSHKSSSTGTIFKGVEFEPKGARQWRARIGINGTNLHLGVFHAAWEAALAYDVAAEFYFAEFAHLNFPELAHFQFHPYP